MKIYFAGSVRGGRDDQETYAQIIQHLAKHGQVLTGHLGNKDLTSAGETGVSEEYVYQRDIAWLKEADAIVAEVSTPAMGVGYEIAKAEEMGKKILCLYRNQPDRKLSTMLSADPHIQVFKYDQLEEALERINEFFAV